MKCKNLKITSKKGIKYGYCKLHDKEVSIFCNKCSFEVKYDLEKINKSKLRKKNVKPIKKRSNKLAKTEKRRFSIIYQDLTKCAVCGQIATEINEVFDGAYRQLSIKHGCCMPMCHGCHQRFHDDRQFALYYKVLFENKLIELYDYDTYMKIFKIDYRYKN